MNRPLLVLVGGFLGAGKTTLIIAAARLLQSRGVCVGVITNDQGGELVDSRWLAELGVGVEEVTGGCFCCRFSDFYRSAERLLVHHPEVIFAEPVGSCVDLSATILQPVKSFYKDRLQPAPLTVLVDPLRAQEFLGAGADPNMAYLFHKQLAEADQVWFSKADLCGSPPWLPRVTTRSMSARTGRGIAEWLNQVLSGNEAAGTRLLDINYEEYAQAEAALGWLNWQADLRLRQLLTPAAVAGPLLEELDGRLTEMSAAIAHLKIFARSDTGFIKASLCRNSEKPLVEGDLAASPARRYELVLNLRARACPELLQSLVNEVTQNLPGRLIVNHRESFRPAPPKPEHRFTSVG